MAGAVGNECFLATQRRPLWTRVWRGSRSSARDGHGTILVFFSLTSPCVSRSVYRTNKLLLSVARSSSSVSRKKKFEHRQDDQQATGLEQQRLVVVICCVYICKWTLERYLTDRLDRNLTNIIDTSNFLPADHLQTQSGHIKCLLCQLQVLDSLVPRFQLVIFSSR